MDREPARLRTPKAEKGEDMIAMEFHEVAELLPMMAEAELHELAVDIKQHGQREPITTWQGKIIDGRNRYSASTSYGSARSAARILST